MFNFCLEEHVICIGSGVAQATYGGGREGLARDGCMSAAWFTTEKGGGSGALNTRHEGNPQRRDDNAPPTNQDED